MFALKTIIVYVLVACLHCHRNSAEPLTLVAHNDNGNNAAVDLMTCEEQLAKYRRFVLQAIINFEDVCDAYNAHTTTNGLDSDGGGTGPMAFFNVYQPPRHRSEIWAFFKLLMAQFNDIDFANVVRDTVIQRCRIKQQRDAKRNAVVLGKKQRFHSWGGKRADPALVGTLDEHSTDEGNFFL